MWNDLVFSERRQDKFQLFMVNKKKAFQAKTWSFFPNPDHMFLVPKSNESINTALSQHET